MTLGTSRLRGRIAPPLFAMIHMASATLVARSASAEPVDEATEATSSTNTDETDPPTDETPEPPPSIAPAPSPGIEPAPGAPSDRSTNEAGKRIGVGLDGLLLLPTSELADATGPLVGPTVRFGYRVIPRLEITLRAGYLFGTNKTANGAASHVDILPLWLGARFFLWKAFVGPYVALEGGMNTHLPTVDPAPTTPEGAKLTDLRRRFGGNAGLGALISENLPLDVRLQVMLLNLIGRDAARSESPNVAVSFSAGYTFQF